MLGRGRLACERLSAGYTLEVLSLRIVLLPLACRQLLVSVRAICEVRTAVFMDAINVFFLVCHGSPTMAFAFRWNKEMSESRKTEMAKWTECGPKVKAT
jgi:hypothetical protein